MSSLFVFEVMELKGYYCKGMWEVLNKWHRTCIFVGFILGFLQCVHFVCEHKYEDSADQLETTEFFFLMKI